MPALLRVLDFAHIELPDTVDRPAIVHDSGRLSLCLRQDDINEILAGRNDFDGFEIVKRHCVECWLSTAARLQAYTPAQRQGLASAIDALQFPF